MPTICPKEIEINVHKKGFYKNIHCCSTHWSEKLETSQVSIHHKRMENKSQYIHKIKYYSEIKRKGLIHKTPWINLKRHYVAILWHRLYVPFTWNPRMGNSNLWWKISKIMFVVGTQGQSEEEHERTFWSSGNDLYLFNFVCMSVWVCTTCMPSAHRGH